MEAELRMKETVFRDTAIEVSGSGYPDLNGTYLPLGQHHGKPRYEKGFLSEKGCGYFRLRWNNRSSQWEFHTLLGTIYYIAKSDTPRPPKHGWEASWYIYQPAPEVSGGVFDQYRPSLGSGVVVYLPAGARGERRSIRSVQTLA